MTQTAFHLPLLSCTALIIHSILLWSSWRMFHIMWKYISSLRDLIRSMTDQYKMYTLFISQTKSRRKKMRITIVIKRWWSATNASHSLRTGETLNVLVIARTKISREIHKIGIVVTALHLEDKIARPHQTHCPGSLNIDSQLFLYFWT